MTVKKKKTLLQDFSTNGYDHYKVLLRNLAKHVIAKFESYKFQMIPVRDFFVRFTGYSFYCVLHKRVTETSLENSRASDCVEAVGKHDID